MTYMYDWTQFKEINWNHFKEVKFDICNPQVWIEDALLDVNASFQEGRPMQWWKYLHCLLA